MKTLGQIAFETYIAKLKETRDLKGPYDGFGDLPERNQEAWEAAAHAAAVEGANRMLDHVKAQWQKEHA